MFGPFKIVRKVFGQLKSDMTPPQLAVAASLGVLMGLTPAGLHWLPITVPVILYWIYHSAGAWRTWRRISSGVPKGIVLWIEIPPW